MPRLGQMLVRADLVSENNLARALGVQGFAGGRIGTLLLERGSVNEDDLGRTLAQQHGCEYVPWRILGEVSAAVIACLPAKFAIKHSAVPYDRSESAIKIALRDPADLRILDELFFVTGRKIIAGVAAEVRIFQALEKYYGERRTPRYAILAEKLSRPVRASRPEAPPPPPSFYSEPQKPGSPLPEPQEIWGDASEHDLASGPPIIQSWPETQTRGGWAGDTSSSSSSGRSTGEIDAISWEEMPPTPSFWSAEVSSATGLAESAPPPAVPPPSARKAPDPAGVAGSSWETPVPAERPAPAPPPPPRPGLRPAAPPPPTSVPGATGLRGPLQSRPAAVSPAPTAPGPSASPPTPPAPAGLARPSDFAEVAAASDRDAIAAAAMRALEGRFARGALFVARPDGVFGWAAARGVNEAGIRAIGIPWKDPSVFLNVRLSRSFYLGPLLRLPRHDALAGALGGWPEECVVHPILMKDKPAGFLYAEGPPERGITPLDLVYLRELAQAASVAFARSIRMRKKEI